MDRMTTPGSVVMTQTRRLRANWPALVLPALAAEMLSMFRFHGHAPWLLLFAVTAVFVMAKPAVAAKIAPFALFGYGFAGFLVAHALLTWQHTMIWYGFFMGRAAHPSLMFVLPEAFLFLAASLWLLVATGGPGARAVRRAVQELRGAGGQPKTVPALLLLPVLFLWEEARANPLWYGAGSCMWQVLGIVIAVAAVVLVWRWPPVAAVAAVRRAARPRPRLRQRRARRVGWVHLLGQRQSPDPSIPGFILAAPGVLSGLVRAPRAAEPDGLVADQGRGRGADRGRVHAGAPIARLETRTPSWPAARRP